jgi:2-hydroxychromene-2-carboxylate isomerase
MRSMDFWCDLASTYTYLSACRIDALATRAHVEVRWRPFTLGPIFAAAGWETSPFNVQAEKGRYMWRDVEREAERIGLSFRKPSAFPRNAVLASKVALLGMQRGWGPRFVQRTMRAEFAEDRDVGRTEVLDEILAEVGLKGPAVRDEATSSEHNGALRSSTAEAMRRHVFGAPTFVVGEEMFWGNDRLAQAIEWAMRDRKPSGSLSLG